MPLLQIERGEILTVVTDQVGVVRELIADDGTIRWSGAYTAWGKLLEELVQPVSPRGPPGGNEPELRLSGLTSRGALATGYGATAPDTGPIFPRPVAPEQDYRGEAYRGATTSPHEAGRPWGYGTPAAHGLDAPSIPGATFAGDPATRDAIRSPFRLLGQYWDEELELACTRFRYWDPEAGRWCSPDPLGITGSLNLSGFNAAPTTHVDPLGLTKKRTGDNSKILAERLAREGRGPGDDEAAAHLVPSTASQGRWAPGKRARDLLAKYGIGVNEPCNGIPLGEPRPHNYTHRGPFLKRLEDRLNETVEGMQGVGASDGQIAHALRRDLRNIGTEVSTELAGGSPGPGAKWTAP